MSSLVDDEERGGGGGGGGASSCSLVLFRALENTETRGSTDDLLLEVREELDDDRLLVTLLHLNRMYVPWP